MEKDDVTKIIYGGILAPSGENSQPWRFVVEENAVFIFNVTGKDTSIYNAGQHGSYVAHGALIENMVISATEIGYASDITYFPSAGYNPVAKIIFTKQEVHIDPLLPYISKRCTNREEYLLNPIPEKDQLALIDEAKHYDTNTFKIVSDSAKKEILVEATIAVEKLMYQNKVFHKFFFQHFFSRQADENKAMGLYINTLGLTSSELFGVKLTQFWFVASFMRITGIVHIVLAMRRRHYRKSGSFGAVISHGHEPINYVQTGRIVERVWLKATELGISAQPCVGVLYLWEGMMKITDSFFTDEETELINSSRNRILEVFEVQGETIPMFFRLGYSKPPKVKAFRSEPEIDFITK